MNATHEMIETSEPVVIPDSIDQCYDLLGYDNVVPMGDFARDAGFEETVLVTPEALRGLVGKSTFDGPPSRLAHAVVDALSELRATMRRYPKRRTLVVAERAGNDEHDDVLVRQNLASAQPYTLVTLHRE